MSPPTPRSRHWLVRLMGWVWWTLLPVRKERAITNYRHAFPDRDPRELKRTMGELVLGTSELLAGRTIEVSGLDEVEPGSIVLTGHCGAVDLLATSVAPQVPCTAFVKEPTNRLARWYVRRRRAQSGGEMLPPHNSMAAAYQALEDGRVLVFYLDQRHNRGIPVPFFGKDAWTSAAFASMAHRTRAPIYGAWTWRDEAGRCTGRVERLALDIPEEREEAISAITASTQDFYERMIRTAPHNWLWLHDRWKKPG